MLRLLRDHGASLILVTHNVEEGLAVATHAAVMLGGRIVRRDEVASLDHGAFPAAYRSMVLEASRPIGEPRDECVRVSDHRPPGTLSCSLASGAQGSGDRVPNAHGVLVSAGICRVGVDDFLFHVG